MTILNEKFVINLQGKDYITYEGLLDLAHQNGLKSIEVEILQYPTKENNATCIAKATATTENKTFIDIGDASPASVNRNIVPHLIRMASTRAKARVLRDLNNVGMTAIEELDNVEDNSNSNQKNPKQNQKTKNKNNQQRITQEQASELKELIRLKKQNIAEILKFNNVPTIESLTLSQYEGVKKFLSNK